MGLWGIEIGVNLWFQRFRAVPRLLCNYRFRWVLTVSGMGGLQVFLLHRAMGFGFRFRSYLGAGGRVLHSDAHG